MAVMAALGAQEGTFGEAAGERARGDMPIPSCGWGGHTAACSWEARPGGGIPHGGSGAAMLGTMPELHDCCSSALTYEPAAVLSCLSAAGAYGLCL